MGTEISRRAMLTMTGTAIVAAAIPVISEAASPEITEVVWTGPEILSGLPAWIVGEPGEWNHLMIRAATRDEALLAWSEEYFGSPEATRVEALDDKVGSDLTDAEWFGAGFGAHCYRCDGETDPTVGEIIDGAAVCHECMTPADWRTINPEYAAELEDELRAATTGADGGGRDGTG